MKIESLHIYPVKGLRGIDLATSAVERRGLAGDRRWMLVDVQGIVITQREQPCLARLTPELMNGHLRVSDGATSIDIATPAPDSKRLKVDLWGEHLEGYVAAEEAHVWFSALLGQRCKLVYQGDLPRPMPGKYAPEGGDTSYADSMPVHITTVESLADLNRRMAKALPMNRFRPSMVVSGGTAWGEDSWKQVCIGGLQLRIAKACLRCSVTTMDQRSGARDGQEPLATLRTFRRRSQGSQSGVAFGQYAIPMGEGVVSVGDPVEVVEA